MNPQAKEGKVNRTDIHIQLIEAFPTLYFVYLIMNKITLFTLL